jgi:uncharacterized membrane protein YfcA
VFPPHLATDGLLLAAAVTAAAGLIRGFTGTGSALIMAPLFTLIFGPVEAIAIAAILDVATTIGPVSGAVRLTPWRVIAPLIGVSWLTLPAGTWLLIYLDPEITKKIIAGMMLFSAAFMLSNWRYAGTPRLSMTVGIGALTGIAVGSTFMGGPVWTFYILAMPFDRFTQRAAFISIIFLSSTAALVSMTANGAVHVDTLWRSAVLLPVYAVTLWFGGRLFLKASDQLFRRIVLMVLIVVGLAILAA